MYFLIDVYMYISVYGGVFFPQMWVEIQKKFVFVTYIHVLPHSRIRFLELVGFFSHRCDLRFNIILYLLHTYMYILIDVYMYISVYGGVFFPQMWVEIQYFFVFVTYVHVHPHWCIYVYTCIWICVYKSKCVCVLVCWCWFVDDACRSFDSFTSVTDVFTCVTRRMRICHVAHSYVWHDAFMMGTWRIDICDVTHSCFWHDSYVYMAWLYIYVFMLHD